MLEEHKNKLKIALYKLIDKVFRTADKDVVICFIAFINNLKGNFISNKFPCFCVW